MTILDSLLQLQLLQILCHLLSNFKTLLQLKTKEDSTTKRVAIWISILMNWIQLRHNSTCTRTPLMIAHSHRIVQRATAKQMIVTRSKLRKISSATPQKLSVRTLVAKKRSTILTHAIVINYRHRKSTTTRLLLNSSDLETIPKTSSAQLVQQPVPVNQWATLPVPRSK